jgi:hypothetical protein
VRDLKAMEFFSEWADSGRTKLPGAERTGRMRSRRCVRVGAEVRPHQGVLPSIAVIELVEEIHDNVPISYCRTGCADGLCHEANNA